MSNAECPDCGVQLNADGTVDALPGEPAEHYLGCEIDRCIGRVRRCTSNRAKTVRCDNRAIAGTRLCEVCSPDMCAADHPAYEADYCPGCGTAASIA